MPSRPLSPHLQIYRWQWTASYSILHRLTGIALSLGVFLMAVWLIALAFNPAAFEMIHHLAISFLGQLILVGFAWALFYHLLNGVRHLFWDAGKGFSLETGQLTGHLVMAGSVVLTGVLVLFVL